MSHEPKSGDDVPRLSNALTVSYQKASSQTASQQHSPVTTTIGKRTPREHQPHSCQRITRSTRIPPPSPGYNSGAAVKVTTNRPLPRIHLYICPSPTLEGQSRKSTSESTMSSPYELRTNDNGKSKKQSMAELKLRRLTEMNQRLTEDLNRRRIPVSEASMDLIAFTDKEPKDFMVPSRWGSVRCAPTTPPYYPPLTLLQIDKRDDPYAPQQQGGCCTIM
ncbi:hypothetical protein LTR48_001308 [Friedmanniomyces endolithicus]|uniref:Guanine nucleotide-binding protein subunit gamma n=1 Tax=Rachicladosporium monterosium TaxID=1507873 RepID=A0ABR0LDS0_9PEZI|nr:hypothetical protein LTR29_006591 [Friedmanniomyces endolithicus]KAK1088708.1 hypothetical protein LTR48_001308 [Friedmanniomyces endolithicus]KAK1820556.1 hypothetical protein LTR12_005004 [Friedmanniomyces endolithicus]KAK5147324.1 hypothetical protein LTR32_001213 [Rachicladosporium monterosium]